MRRFVLLCTALVPVPAAAQEAGQIIVTAPGGSVDADEVQAADRDAIARGPRTDLAAALASEIPGVSISEAQGNPWAAAITWRGYSAGALQGTEQGMAVYLDGVRFNQPFGDTLTLDLVPEAALMRAELREPNPVYGRNALGGAVLLQTAMGFDLPGGRVSLSVDGFGGYGGSASYGTRNVLVSVEALHDEGWRDFSPSDLLRGFLWAGHHGVDWGIDATLIGADTSLTGNGVAPVELLAADYRAIFTRPDTSDARFGRATLAPYIEVGGEGRLTVTAHYQALRRISANGDLADFEECEGDFLCVGDDYELDPLLDNDSGARVRTVEGIEDYAVFNRGRERTHGGGLGLQYNTEHETKNGQRRFAIGAEWSRYRTNFEALSELGELLEDRSVVGLGTDLVSQDGGITPVSVTTNLREISIYASAEIPLTQWLSVEGGARWSDSRVELVDRIGSALNGTHRFRRLSPAIELDVEATDTLDLSVGFAETSRNPTPAELSCADPEAPCALANFFVADPPLRQVVAKNWHAEAKWEEGPLSAHAALWRSDSSDDIRHIASDIRGRAYFANIGNSRRQGVELTAQWSHGPWSASTDYVFTDASFRSAFTISAPGNSSAGEDGEISVVRGDRLPGIPRHAINTRLGYDKGRWALQAQARWRSGQVLFGDEGNDNAPTPGYLVVDFSGEFALTQGIAISAQVANLFDRHYATFGTFAEIDEITLAEVPDASDPRAYAPGIPRRISIGLKARF